MILDCDNSFAPHALREVRSTFIDCVREQGIASIVTQNAHHLSALGLDILPLAEAGLIAIMMSGTLPWVVPHGGTRPILGTNPMAFASPRIDAPPVLWDQAASICSVSDIHIAQRSGEQLAMLAGLNSDGNPTANPNEILASRKLLPFGEHKGTAIALMIEILAIGLSGGNFAANYSEANYGPTNPAGQFVLAIDPNSVAPHFTNHVRSLLEKFESNGTARIPGDGRFHRQQLAESNGVFIPAWLAETLELL